jgi:hypothetical protein
MLTIAVFLLFAFVVAATLRAYAAHEHELTTLTWPRYRR